jgi:hypothetical protein
MTEPCPLQEWARLKRDLRQASDAVLEKYHLNWGDVNRMEIEAMAVMQGSDTVETEFGTVQRIPDKPVQYRVRKSADDTEATIFKSRLKFIPKEASNG